MKKLIVSYLLVNTDYEQRIEHIDVQSDLKGPVEPVHVEVKQKLSAIVGLPVDEIKVIGMTIRY